EVRPRVERQGAAVELLADQDTIDEDADVGQVVLVEVTRSEHDGGRLVEDRLVELGALGRDDLTTRRLGAHGASLGRLDVLALQLEHLCLLVGRGTLRDPLVRPRSRAAQETRHRQRRDETPATTHAAPRSKHRIAGALATPGNRVVRVNRERWTLHWT